MYFCLHLLSKEYLACSNILCLTVNSLSALDNARTKITPYYLVEDVLEPLKEGPVTHVHPCINATW